MACKGCQKQNLNKEALDILSLDELVNKFFAIDSKNTILCKIINKNKDIIIKKTKEELFSMDRKDIIDKFLFIQNENMELTNKLIADRKKNNSTMQKKEVLSNKNVKKLLLVSYQSPGDILMLTAAVKALHQNHPGKFITDIDTSCGDLWVGNPYIKRLNWHKDKKDEKEIIVLDDKDIEIIKCEYPLIHKSNTSPYHFIHGYVKFLEYKLDIRIELNEFKGDIYLSEEEKKDLSFLKKYNITDNFWIIMGGGKYDFTAKWWNPAYYQDVVDNFKDNITFVQCGEEKHWHPKLNNVIDLIGKTNTREFLKLIYHSSGIVCPITFAMHASVAVPYENRKLKNRPCIVIAGGREPAQWEAYPHHRFLSVNGCLDCCDNGGCWVSRCQKVGDGDKKDQENLCRYPIIINDSLSIPKCMDMIKPEDVIRAIEMYCTDRPSSDLSFGNGAVSRDEYFFLKQVAKDNEIKNVIEFGPGTSTQAFVKNNCEIYSFESNDRWLYFYRDKFKNNDKVHLIKFEDNNSYDDILKNSFDIAVVDGPVGKKEFSRMSSCLIASKVTDNILMHDASRKGEQDTIKYFIEQGWKYLSLNKKNTGYNTRFGLLFKDKPIRIGNIND